MTHKKFNTGDRNTGNRNTGNRNTGDWNTGNRNTGNRNTGDWNTGDFNTGNRNTGDWNTGDFNTGDWNTGFFNTETPKTIMVFDNKVDRSAWDECIKPGFIYFDLIVWVDESDMTKEEKDQNEGYENTCGYLKKKDYKEAFQESYKNASKEDRERIFNIPNFDADKFFEISGIDVRKDIEKEDKKIAILQKAQELIDKAEELKKEAESM